MCLLRTSERGNFFENFSGMESWVKIVRFQDDNDIRKNGSRANPRVRCILGKRLRDDALTRYAILVFLRRQKRNYRLLYCP